MKAGINKAVQTGSDFYTLSYVPPGSEYDGRHHTIKLEVDKPGLHLTYRDAYYAEDPSKMSPTRGLTLGANAPATPIDMRAAMGRAMPTSTDILFDLQVEPSTLPPNPADPPGAILGTLNPKLKDKPLVRYSFQYAIPASQIDFSAAPTASATARSNSISPPMMATVTSSPASAKP